jgi:hypothetical protein
VHAGGAAGGARRGAGLCERCAPVIEEMGFQLPQAEPAAVPA